MHQVLLGPRAGRQFDYRLGRVNMQDLLASYRDQAKPRALGRDEEGSFGIGLRRRGAKCQTMAARPAVSPIVFDAVVSAIDKWTILRLPESASKQLPSRGQVAVSGTINGHVFRTVVEPDGTFGHWIKVDARLRQAAALKTGTRATVKIAPASEWPEPSVPADLKMAIAGAPSGIQNLWKEITPMARWEWVRWVNETKNPDTRKRRVDVTISKMQHGKRRPCCFNLAACTDPDLARSGKLVDRA